MDFLRFQPFSLRTLFSILLTCVLVFSLGLHAIQIQHEHFEVFHTHTHQGEENEVSVVLDVVMHLSDKKLFLLGLIVLMFTKSFWTVKEIIAGLLLFDFRIARVSYDRFGDSFRIYDFQQALFRKGIFHTKVF